MQHYIIDGNNLIGKIKKLWNLQKKDRQASRENLAYLLEHFFSGKKVKVTLDYDGFENLAIKTSKVKIYYSQKKSADDLIKHQIEMSDNSRLITVVTSDSNIIQFAKVCRCNTLKSEEFYELIRRQQETDKEEELKKNISNNEIKKLFGLE